MGKSTAFGWLSGICVFVALSQFLPEVLCADGWASPSIGRQGACSHHGGVKGNGIYVFLIIGVSIWTGVSVSNKFSTIKHGNRPRVLDERDTFSEEVPVISSAIEQGRRIEFLYKKPKSTNYEIRTIKPIEFKNIPHTYGSRSTLCIKGFCEKRSANRNFALKRMKDLRVI